MSGIFPTYGRKGPIICLTKCLLVNSEKIKNPSIKTGNGQLQAKSQSKSLLVIYDVKMSSFAGCLDV